MPRCGQWEESGVILLLIGTRLPMVLTQRSADCSALLNITNVGFERSFVSKWLLVVE